MASEWPLGIVPASNQFIHSGRSQWGFPKLTFLNIRPLVLNIYIKRSSVWLIDVSIIHQFIEHNGRYLLVVF